MERCAVEESLRRHEDEVRKAELFAERELEFFHDDVDDLLDQIAGIAMNIHTLGSRYETIPTEDIREMILEAVSC